MTGRVANSGSALTGHARVATEKRIWVVFRNDDPSACSDAAHERRVTELFDRYGCRQTMGVVAFCESGNHHDTRPVGETPLESNPDMVRFLRQCHQQRGWEIAVHGLTHRANRLSVPSRREYTEFRGLDRLVQERMLRRALEHIEQTLGVRPCTFIPPWNTLDHATVCACRDLGLQVVSAGLYAPQQEGMHLAGTNCDLASLPQWLAWARQGEHSSVLVVMLHSGNLTRPGDMDVLERALTSARSTPGAEVVTLAELARQAGHLLADRNAAGRILNPFQSAPLSGAARSGLYRRALQPVLPRKLRRTTREQLDAYRRGDYASAAGLGRTLERRWRRIMWAARGLSGAAGIGLAMGASWLRSWFGWGGVWALLGAASLCAGAVWHKSTSTGTRREVLTLAGCLAGGLAAGWALSRCLGL